jgi:hypothetical protein
MGGGPFTQKDQWHHPGIVDRTQCSVMLRCIKNYKDLIVAILGPASYVGSDGDDFVVKNGSAYDLFDDGFYRKRINIIVEGQPQSGHDSTAYNFDSIP